MNKLGVKGRAFLLAFMPMVLITSVLSIYFISSQLENIETSINEHGKMITIHMARASEYGVFSENHENLNALLKQFITEEDVESITITDKAGVLITKSSKQKTENDNFPLENNPGIRVFRYPVTLLTAPIEDITEPENSTGTTDNQEVLGWVITEFSTTRLIQQQKDIIWNAVYIILAGMIASVLLAFWISRGLTIPISRLTDSVRKIERGELNINIDHSSSGEIGSLEKGVGSMLKKIRITQNELQDTINKTTSGLRDSLKLLEKQNQELSAARKEALLASKTKSRFLANMSHEIRTPMNGILGFIRLLKNTTPTKEQNDYLNTIDKSANNLLSLIDDILDISIVESGKIQIKNVSFDLEKCVNDVITLMTPAAKDKGIEISSFHYSDTPKEIYAPRDRIRQILINYVGNAIKFSERGAIVIRTMLSSNEEQGDAIKISVSDKGIGIAEDDKNSLFTPFNQLDDTSTKQHSGTGLGLAISKSLTEAMGGEVGVESETGKGSTFWFSFLYKSNIPVDIFPAESPAHVNSPSISNNKELNGRNILIAEDNEINTKLLKTILEHEGVNIFHAKNGEDAIDHYLNSTLDLILMDIHMPVMNGVDATKIIRDTEINGNHIPIIGITANAIEEDNIIFESSGIDVILLKPIAIDDLLHEIRFLIRKFSSNSLNSTDNQKNVSLYCEPDIKIEGELNSLGVNHKLVSSLKKMLIDELPHIKKQLNTHFASQNWDVLREQIHRLLGGTAYCDVPELRNAALSFQTSLKEETDSLDNNFKSLLSEINSLMRT